MPLDPADLDRIAESMRHPPRCHTCRCPEAAQLLREVLEYLKAHPEEQHRYPASVINAYLREEVDYTVGISSMRGHIQRCEPALYRAVYQ